MRTSGLFTTSTYRIKVNSFKDTLYLVPFSDVHWGSPEFCHTAWGEFREWGEQHPTAYFIGNGDYLDAFRATTRNLILNNTEENERVTLDEDAKAKLVVFEKEIEFMRGRLIGLGDGNHGWKLRDGRWDSEVLAQMMGCKFLGVSTVIKIILEYGTTKQTSFLYQQHHGRAGGGTTVGAPFNAIERQGRFLDSVQVSVQGDDHQLGILKGKPRIRMITDNRGELVPREYTPFYMRSGGFTKAYDPGSANYIVDSGRGPSALGAPVLQLRVAENDEEGFHVRMGEGSMI